MPQDNITLKTHFCMAPFIHTMVDTQNRLRLCCVNDKLNLGTVDDGKFDNLWKSPEYQKVRQDMINNLPITGCDICYAYEKNGSISDRILFNRNFKNIINVKTGNDTDFPISFDLRSNNLCNLKCLMCCPVNSTQISKEEEENKDLFSFHKKDGKIKIIEHKLRPTRSSEWFKDFQEKIVNVKDPWIKLLGGEPTIINEYMDLLSKLIENNIDPKYLNITTNLTNFNKSFKKILTSFSNLGINCSIDGLGLYLEYIRYPINYRQWDENFNKLLEIFKNENRNMQIKTASVVQALNVSHLPDMVDFFIDTVHRTQNPNFGFIFTEVISVPPLDISLVPAETRLIVADQLEEKIKILDTCYQNDSRLNFIINRLRNVEECTVDRTEMVVYLLKKDISRNIHIKNYIPEIYNLIEDQYETTKLEMLNFLKNRKIK